MTESSMNIPVAHIIEATGGELLRGDPSLLCNRVSTDSRTISPGDLFVPLEGIHHDGHDYLAPVLDNGASAVLVSARQASMAKTLPGNAPVVIVEDTLRALGDLAQWWRQQFSIPVIAVTGSSGKTTTKEMIASTAGISFNILKNSGNLNNCIGLPLSLLQLRKSHTAVVLEAATNHSGEIARLTEIAAPDVAVITNVGPAHLQGFGSLEAVREEKGSIFQGLRQDGMAVINRDDANILVLEDRWRGRSISFGIAEQATVRAEHLFTRGDMGVSFTLRIGALTRGVDMTTLGVHNIYNALAAAAASWAIDVPFDEICRGLAEFRQVAGRMNVTRLASGVTLIDDSYNANPASTAAALKTLALVKGAGTSVVVFGDMLELGDQAEEKHREIGALMASTGAGQLFLTGKQSEAVAEGARRVGMNAEAIHQVTDPEEVLSRIQSLAGVDLWVLVKGSRGMRMERFSEAIKATGEEKA